MSPNQPFHRVGIYCHQPKKHITTLTRLQSLLAAESIEIYLESLCAQVIQTHTQDPMDFSQLLKKIDLLIIVGGDGSVLNASHKASTASFPPWLRRANKALIR